MKRVQKSILMIICLACIIVNCSTIAQTHRLVYSTYLGGSQNDGLSNWLNEFAVDASGDDNSGDIIIGQEIQIESKILNEQRSIYIYTPRGYENSDKLYPVVYVLDGETSIHHVSGIVQFLSSSELIPNLIVVAIPNTNRRRDLLPFIEGADNFRKFISNELIPAIDEKYHTAPYRILAGHSWGAIFTIYSFLKNPRFMNAYIASSPWLNNNMRAVCDEASDFVKEHSSLNNFVYLTVGDEPDFITGIEILAKIFNENPVDNLDWNFQRRPGENHNSITHPTIYNGLMHLFSDWRILENVPIDSLKSFAASLQRKYGYPVRTYEDILKSVGQQFFEDENYDNAIRIQKEYVNAFPDSSQGYVNLGEIYLKTGDRKAAAEYFEKAIILNPNHEDISKRLREIEKSE